MHAKSLRSHGMGEQYIGKGTEQKHHRTAAGTGRKRVVFTVQGEQQHRQQHHRGGNAEVLQGKLKEYRAGKGDHSAAKQWSNDGVTRELPFFFHVGSSERPKALRMAAA